MFVTASGDHAAGLNSWRFLLFCPLVFPSSKHFHTTTPVSLSSPFFNSSPELLSLPLLFEQRLVL